MNYKAIMKDKSHVVNSILQEKLVQQPELTSIFINKMKKMCDMGHWDE
jgi:hypothetical protein